MTVRSVRLHPAAATEVERARKWYAERSVLAAHAFLIVLDHLIAEIAEAPERWPSYLAGTRRHSFRHFPFNLIYRIEGDALMVIAVSHHRRKPGYWIDRGPAHV